MVGHGRPFRGLNAPALEMVVVRGKDLFVGENNETVLNATKNLPKNTPLGFFVVLTLEDQQYSTYSKPSLPPKPELRSLPNEGEPSAEMVIEDTGSVEWDDHFKFEVEDSRSWLDMEVFVGENGPARQSLGCGELCLEGLYHDAVAEEWVRLEGPLQCKAAVLLRITPANAATIFPARGKPGGVPPPKPIRRRGQKESEIDRISTMPSFHPTHVKYDVSNTLIKEEDMKREFAKFDHLDNGYITKKQFKQFYRNWSDHFGLSRADAELDYILQPFKSLPENRITFDEFCLLVLRLLSNE